LIQKKQDLLARRWKLVTTVALILDQKHTIPLLLMSVSKNFG
jgi:hypothetical protein